MMSVGRFCFLLIVVATSFRILPAQTKKLELDWLAKDVAAIGLIPTLLPSQDQTVDAVRAAFGEHSISEDEYLGFGASRIQLRRGNGYTHLTVNLFTVKGAIVNYEISVSGSRESWAQIRPSIIDAWKLNRGPEFRETDTGLSYSRFADPELQIYKKAVAAELGDLRVVKVPAELKDHYEYLISPFNNSVVGSGGCGYAGIKPAGRESMDALMKVRRIDLIENVLRGYNPGGRVFAALALLDMEKQGSRLNDEIRATLKKVSDLEMQIETCSGCIYSCRTAKEILESPQPDEYR